MLEAPPEFCLTVSYNPGYQSVLKDLKQSTRQRFVALHFSYPQPDREVEILVKETGVNTATATMLVRFAGMTRNLKDNGLTEGASTRLIVNAARLIRHDIAPRQACETAVNQALTDDEEILKTVRELCASVL